MTTCEITPNGDVRIVFAGPLRVLKFDLVKPARLDAAKVRIQARALEVSGDLKVRAPELDSSAQTVFNLAGTKDSLFPLGLIDAFELPINDISAKIRPAALQFVGKHSPFKSFETVAAVLRLFENGYGAVILTIDFRVAPEDRTAETVAFLAQYFAHDSGACIALRAAAIDALNGVVPQLCRKLTVSAADRQALEGKVRFLSTFYVLSGAWDSRGAAPLTLQRPLHAIVQPDANDSLPNQSNSNIEFVSFTSGFHLYVWNRNDAIDHLQRSISLVSFLNLMNILYAEIDDIKDDIATRLKTGRTPWFAPTDLDEKLEIMYGQIMVSSASWRRDFSSFRDEINRRWRLSEAKQFCITLIAALEARSARKRALFLGVLIALFTLMQVVSVIEDGAQLLDRYPRAAAPASQEQHQPPTSPGAVARRKQ
jgi:hypothetical protein